LWKRKKSLEFRVRRGGESRAMGSRP